jgi:archaellum component FlaC
MYVFRKAFERCFRKLIPKTVEAHLSRLAYHWEIRINRTIDEVRDQAMTCVKDELATIDAPLSGLQSRTGSTSTMIEELKQTLDQTAE